MDSENKKNYYVYVLECNDQTYYTGYTTDLAKRLQSHNQGKGAKYTRSRLPVSLVIYWLYDDLSDALKIEAKFKQCTRKQKERLINREPSSSELKTFLLN